VLDREAAWVGVDGSEFVVAKVNVDASTSVSYAGNGVQMVGRSQQIAALVCDEG